MVNGRRRADDPEAHPEVVEASRGVWSWPERILYWAYGFLVGPFLAKLPDGTVQGSMTRWAVAAFTVAEIVRLVAAPRIPLGWPDAFVVFFILFALPIDNALSKSAPEKVLDALTSMFRRGGGDDPVAGTSTLSVQQTTTVDPAVPVAPEQGEGDV